MYKLPDHLVKRRAKVNKKDETSKTDKGVTHSLRDPLALLNLKPN